MNFCAISSITVGGKPASKKLITFGKINTLRVVFLIEIDSAANYWIQVFPQHDENFKHLIQDVKFREISFRKIRLESATLAESLFSDADEGSTS